jgi:hypothetical protein
VIRRDSPKALLALLALLAAGPLLPAAAHAAEERVCDRSESRLTPSPDGSWTASVQEEVCSTERGAAAAITVVLVPRDAPQETGRVVATAVPASRDDWARVVWRSAGALEVWVPNLAHVVEVKPAYCDVQVTLKYCGDNPQDRARVAGYQDALKAWMRETTAWVERRKQDAATAGPRPTRPEEPRAPMGRCNSADFPR